ncbi:unnamed protein product [Strongylus vulgaris]|uniref:Golgin-84 n=1 Tax=Strongylus vulgaris TaxID=40348 RepID=A0A3P7K2Q0_STRVU|nr:unnamed protein product [Strongylus vulgaris]
MGSSAFREPSPIQSIAAEEGNQSVLSNMSESILNSTLANTSIDYEKDERIQRLENEVLQSELEGAHSAVKSAKNDLELLNMERDGLLEKIEKLSETNTELDSSLKREKDLSSSLRSSLEKQSTEIERLHGELDSARSQAHSLAAKLSESTETISRLEEQLKHARGEPTDAGDETQILHLRNNPLQCAMDEVAESERARKRKADDTFGDESSEAKRAREEKIHALEAQLRKSERDKEQALRLQTDFAKKYRYMK